MWKLFRTALIHKACMYIFVFFEFAFFGPEEVQTIRSQKDSTREGQQGKTRTGEWKTKQEQDNAKRWCWSDGALVATNHDGNVHIGHLTDGTLASRQAMWSPPSGGLHVFSDFGMVYPAAMAQMYMTMVYWGRTPGCLTSARYRLQGCKRPVLQGGNVREHVT